MKYTIIINQLALQQLAPDLDLIDATILDFLIHFCSADNENIAKMTFSEGGTTRKFTWINFKHLMRELPILKIKSKSAISKRIQRIDKAGFIKIRQEFGSKGRLYVRLTEKIQNLFFKASVPLDAQGGVRVDDQVFLQKNIQHSNIKEDTIVSSIKKEDFTPEKDSRVREIINFYYQWCINKKGFKPIISVADAGMIKRRLNNGYSSEEIQEEIAWFLDSKKSQELGPTLKTALSGAMFNTWLAQRGN